LLLVRKTLSISVTSATPIQINTSMYSYTLHNQWKFSILASWVCY